MEAKTTELEDRGALAPGEHETAALAVIATVVATGMSLYIWAVIRFSGYLPV
jgi:hypothetical protein